MYASIQDAYSKLLHIQDGRCLDFLACHDAGYQHANFQKYRTCDKKLRDICLSLLFSGTPGIWVMVEKLNTILGNAVRTWGGGVYTVQRWDGRNYIYVNRE